MAAADAKQELRIVPVRGLNDVEKKAKNMPKAVVSLFQGLQYAIPTFAFHTFSECIALSSHFVRRKLRPWRRDYRNACGKLSWASF